MKKSLLILAALISTQTYATCGVTYPERDYQLDTGNNNFNLTSSDQYSVAYVGNNILNNCQNGNIFINALADFSINTSTLSGTSPFQLTDNFDFVNLNASAEDIIAAKEFLKQNLRLTFSLQDNTNINTAKVILSSGIRYNIIPETTAYPTNTIIVAAGLHFYTGQEGNGVRSLGVRFVNPIITIQNNNLLSASVVRGLNGGRLSINTGTLNMAYFYTNNAFTMYTQDTDLLLSIGFQANSSTCNVNVPNQLNLGSTTVELLNSSHQNKNNFNIEIICSTAMPQTQFNLKLVDANDLTNVNSNGVLSNTVNSEVKSNAIIQLINNLNNEPFEIGTDFQYLRTDANDARTVISNSAAAQIVKAEEKATAGKIESKVTFFVDYE